MESEDSNIQVCTVICDMIHDLQTTFPEFKTDLENIKNTMDDVAGKKAIIEYCLKVYPQRFFDILYKNDEMFSDKEINTEFLPNIDFAQLFNAKDVSENTQNAIWKYLQIILFSIVGSLKDKDDFGDAASLFSGIQEDDLQDKMKEVFENMEGFFTNLNEDDVQDEDGEKTGETKEDASGETNEMPQMPNLDGIRDHLQNLFNGKIGSLAKEMAEEISGDFQNMFGSEENFANVRSTKDIFAKLVRNPNKIKEIIKKVTTKLEEKMKSGNVSKQELMKEASEIMKKMKEMGNGGEFEEMMKNMAKTMGGKGARFNKGAFEQMARQGQQRERLQKKLEERRKAKIIEENNKTIFKIDGETQAKSSLSNEDMDKMQAEMDLENKTQQQNSSNKKKGKKKKGKGKK
jgi:hypothetical protein